MSTERPPAGSHHVLKTNPEYFTPAWDARKPYEVRVNDRGYQYGDHVRLVEFDPHALCQCLDPRHGDRERCAKYSGRWVEATVGYVLPVYDAMAPRVVFGLLDRTRSDGDLVLATDAGPIDLPPRPCTTFPPLPDLKQPARTRVTTPRRFWRWLTGAS